MDIRWLPIKLSNEQMKPKKDIKKLCHEKHIPFKESDGIMFVMVNKAEYNETVKLFSK